MKTYSPTQLMSEDPDGRFVRVSEANEHMRCAAETLAAQAERYAGLVKAALSVRAAYGCECTDALRENALHWLNREVEGIGAPPVPVARDDDVPTTPEPAPGVTGSKERMP